MNVIVKIFTLNYNDYNWAILKIKFICSKGIHLDTFNITITFELFFFKINSLLKLSNLNVAQTKL